MSPIDRPIPWGMVGGGEGAFIGAVHRQAARLDGCFSLVAGAFSSDPERCARTGAAIGLDPARVYADYRTMAAMEAERPDGIRAVSIVTPNALHFAQASAFLEAGIDVICEKPMTLTLDEAERLALLVERCGRSLVLTHNYSAYPMVREARRLVLSGDIGQVRHVQVEYAQGWLSEDVTSRQADWRLDPAIGGAGCVGDIGTHAFQLACFVTSLRATELLADLTSFVPGRRTNDNAAVLLRFDGGAKGMLWASQIASGYDNALTLRVIGSAGHVSWRQETPEILAVSRAGEPVALISRNGPGSGDPAMRASRLPAGHPEGFLEGLANLYRESAMQFARSRQAGMVVDETLPGPADGVDGLRFIAACLRSNEGDGIWTDL